MEPWIPAYEKLGHVANRTGSRLAESTPNNLYPTGDGDFIHITAMADSLFRRLAEAMGRPELAEDARFAKALERNRNSEALDAHHRATGRRRSRSREIERKLEAAGVPATRIYTIADIFRDPHYAARGSIVAAPDRDLGAVAMAGVVPRLSDNAGRGPARRPRRRRGHARRARANCSATTARNRELERSGVIACAAGE